MSKPHTVIIPAYRPEHRLIPMVDDVLSRGYAVVVVDDGSGAEYAPVFEGLDERVTLLRHSVNRGKGAAIKTGLAYVKEQNEQSPSEDRVRYLCIMDADGQHLPEDMERVLRAAENCPTGLTLGVREVSGKMPLRSRFGNAVTRGIFRLLTGARVSDTQTGLRAFSVHLIPKMLKVEGNRYEYEMGVLAYMAKHRLPFQEIPISTLYKDMKNSTSHFRAVRDSILIYATLLKFAGSSFISFLADYGMFLLFTFLLCRSDHPWLVEWGGLVANVFSRILSSVLNYYLNCRFVFGQKPSWTSATEYTILALIILGINSILLYLWMLTPVPVTVCKLLAEICTFLVNYFVQKKFIFKKKKR